MSDYKSSVREQLNFHSGARVSTQYNRAGRGEEREGEGGGGGGGSDVEQDLPRDSITR